MENNQNLEEKINKDATVSFEGDNKEAFDIFNEALPNNNWEKKIIIKNGIYKIEA